jgi:hypothetical protein
MYWTYCITIHICMFLSDSLLAAKVVLSLVATSARLASCLSSLQTSLTRLLYTILIQHFPLQPYHIHHHNSFSPLFVTSFCYMSALFQNNEHMLLLERLCCFPSSGSNLGAFYNHTHTEVESFVCTKMPDAPSV